MWAAMQALQPVFVLLNSIYFYFNDNDNDDNVYVNGYYNDNGYANHEKAVTM